MIVVVSPLIYLNPRFFYCSEPVPIQALVSKLAVETFHKGILSWLTRLDKSCKTWSSLEFCIKKVGSLETISAPWVLIRAISPLSSQVLYCLRRLGEGGFPFFRHRQTFRVHKFHIRKTNKCQYLL